MAIMVNLLPLPYSPLRVHLDLGGEDRQRACTVQQLNQRGRGKSVEEAGDVKGEGFAIAPLS
jgi:hypothetical protein